MLAALTSCLALVAGPATAQAPARADLQLFEQPEAHVGGRFVVKGVLNYEFENRNLYPRAPKEPHEEPCLPIAAANAEIVRALERLNGRRVLVTGVIEKFTGTGVPGHDPEALILGFSGCKDFGLVVDHVRPANRRR